MGPAIESPRPTVTSDQLVEQIRSLAQATEAVVGGSRWYLFGSGLNDPELGADVDLLVVCPDHSASIIVRCGLRGIRLARPLDLSILTDEEEAEIGFVAQQECVQVFPWRRSQ